MDAPPSTDTGPDDLLARAERWVVVVLFLLLTVIGCIQILSRHVSRLPVANLEQLMPHIFMAITYLGMSLTFRHRGHLAVELLPTALGPRWERRYRIGIWLATCAFLAILTYASIDVIAFQLEIGAVTNMGYPAALLTACVPIGAMLSILRIWQVEIRPLLQRPVA